MRFQKRDGVLARDRPDAAGCKLTATDACGVRVDDAADVRARAVDLAVQRQLVGHYRAPEALSRRDVDGDDVGCSDLFEPAAGCLDQLRRPGTRPLTWPKQRCSWPWRWRIRHARQSCGELRLLAIRRRTGLGHGPVAAEVGSSLVHVDDVRVLHVHVEEAHRVARAPAIGDGLARHDDAKPGGAAVDGGRAHAAARRHAGHDDRVDAPGRELRRERRAEEARRVLLDEQRLVRSPPETGVDLDPARALDEHALARDLARPDTGLDEVGVVRDGGEDDRDAGRARRLEQPHDLGDGRADVGPERRALVREAARHVHDEQGRPLAEARPAAEALLADRTPERLDLLLDELAVRH